MSVGSAHVFDATGLRKLVRLALDEILRGEERDKDEDEEDERR